MTYNLLTPKEKNILENKGTEHPFSGEFEDFYKEGTFICRKCNNPLFSSKAKFDARCGWPSFDEHFKDSVLWQPDKDGFRTEILCANCNGHLGHVFEGERFTEKNTRHCVNSLSIKFVPQESELPQVLHE